MAYVNTGYERAKTLTVDKQVSSVSLSGYPKTYNILLEFTVAPTTYPLLTSDAFAQLSTEDYATRLAAFKVYVQNEEGIADLDAITDSEKPAYRENTTACPIGE